MSIPTGKGFFLWQIPRCGTPAEITALAVQAKINHIFIKIADGIADFNVINGRDLAKELTALLRVAGIEPWGWGYAYLANPVAEATKAAERVAETGVVGFAIDAETQCKGKPGEAHTYCNALRAAVDIGFPIGLSSYRFPSLHPELPWDIFRQHCDFDMPQMYWTEAHNPGNQLIKSYNEFRNMTRQLPYIATGSTYKSEYSPWMPSVNEVNEFMSVAKTLGIAFNFWEWYDARFILPRAIWDAIAEWNIVVPPLPKLVRVTANVLNIRRTPNGIIAGNVPLGTILGVTGEALDGNGDKWYRVGSCYCASWWCENV